MHSRKVPILVPGRIYCYADNRWVTCADDNYGIGYYQFNEACGTGIDPIMEWGHMGILMMPNERLTDIIWQGWSNDAALDGNGVVDVEMSVIQKFPDPVTRYNTGFDNDSEIKTVELFRDRFWSPNDKTQPEFDGNSNDMHLRHFHVKQGVQKNYAISQLCIYFKPSGTRTANDYFRNNLRLNFG